MKRVMIILGMVALAGTFNTQKAGAQIADKTAVAKLLRESESDSLRRIERMAALEFHKLLNAYRTENGQQPVQWNETLWLTSRNHNIWMDAHGTLSHHQKEKTKHFSGVGPGERYAYASGGNAEQSWSGENALYNYSAYGKTEAQIAKHIAEASFKQWKNSPGHNANMLGSGHKLHGTAFLIAKDRVWGTDLFARCYTCPEPSEIDKNLPIARNTKPDDVPGVNVFKSQVQEQKATASAKNTEIKTPKPVKINVQKSSMSLTQSAYSGIYGGLKRNKALETAAEKHALYLLNAKKVSSVQQKNSGYFYGETPLKRVMKASGGLFFFSGGKKNLKESIAVIELDTENYSEQLAMQEMKKSLGEQTDGAKMAGVSVQMRKKKNQLKIVAVGLHF
ncbi:MAG: CAP domain-containing protein [Flavobacteriales bacterium]|nr:CAP domain-containing protein [Flavobacteriales bacterium]